MKQRILSLFNINNPKLLLLNSAYVLFLIAFISKFVMRFFLSFPLNSFTIGDFLINYQGGFVRRGLIGEILYFFAKSYNINVVWVIKIICFICFSFICIFFVKSFIKKGYALYILPLCFFMGAMVLNNDYCFRKDSLMIFFLIIILLIFINSHISKIVKFLIINILAIFIILTHETFVFFSIPVLFFLVRDIYSEKGISKSFFLSFVFLFPSIIAFILVVFMSGNQEISQSIWNSWLEIFNEEPSIVPHFSAIGSIGWDKQWTMEFHLRMNFLRISNNIFVAFVSYFTFIVIYYIATNAIFIFNKNNNDFVNRDKNALSAILIFQFICLSPLLTVLSCDMIRITFYWIASSFAIFILIPPVKIEKMIPSFFARFIDLINKKLSAIITPTKTTVVLLMMVIGFSHYSFQFDSYFFSTVIYNILLTVSQFFLVLKKILFFLFI